MSSPLFASSSVNSDNNNLSVKELDINFLDSIPSLKSPRDNRTSSVQMIDQLSTPSASKSVSHNLESIIGGGIHDLSSLLTKSNGNGGAGDSISPSVANSTMNIATSTMSTAGMSATPTVDINSMFPSSNAVLQQEQRFNGSSGTSFPTSPLQLPFLNVPNAVSSSPPAAAPSATLPVGGGGGGGQYGSSPSPPLVTTSSPSSSSTFFSPPLPSSALKTTLDSEAQEKQKIIFNLQRMARIGVPVTKKYNMADSLEEMRSELQMLKKEMDLVKSVETQRHFLMGIVGAIETGNEMMDPVGLQLNGWSESVSENITQYDDIFEEIHELYGDNMKAHPILRLMLGVGGSAIMYHYMHRKSALSSSTGNSGGGSNMSSLFNMMSMFGGNNDSLGGGGGGPPQGPPQGRPQGPSTSKAPNMSQPKSRTVQGPSGFEDLIGAINNQVSSKMASSSSATAKASMAPPNSSSSSSSSIRATVPKSSSSVSSTDTAARRGLTINF